MAIQIEKMTREEYEKRYGVPVPTFGVQPDAQDEERGTFATGFAKSFLGSAKGALKLSGQVASKVAPKKFGLKGFMSEEDIQQRGFGFEKKFLSEDTLRTRPGEGVGKFVGDVAQFAIPGTAAHRATQAASAIPRIAARAGVSGAVGAAQTGDIRGGAIAAGAEVAAPGVAKAVKFATKPVVSLIGRLLKGTGSSLSGASSGQIQAILDDPIAARQAVKEIKRGGGASLLRRNAREIVEGVAQVKKEARGAFGKGLEELSSADINPTTFRQNVGKVLAKYGVMKKGGQRVLQNVEFDDPKHMKKASELIDKFSKTDLDGKALRKLANDIDAAKYTIAKSDERLAFNAFLKDLSKSLKQSISESTTKLDDINKAFTQEIQLAEEIEKIFVKVKFKNAKEVLTVSQKLERLFNQRGLAPETIDRFLQRIDIQPSGFRATEAARQLGELAPQANTLGTSVYEMIRAFTSAVVPPQAVRQLSIMTGIANNVIEEVATKLSPVARSAFVRIVLSQMSPDQNNAEEN